MGENVLYLNPDIEVIIAGDDEDGQSLMLENIRENRRYNISDNDLLGLLDQTVPAISEDELAERVVSELEPGEFEMVINQLISKKILLRQREVSSDIGWNEHGWSEAADYYRCIQDYSFVDYGQGKEAEETDIVRMEQYLEKELPPENYLNYDDAPTVDLPDPSSNQSSVYLRDVLAYDLTTEQTSVSKDDLGQLLYFTFGEMGTLEFPPQGEFLLKTSPSGGARHPTEAYVLALNVTKLQQGIYHYSVRNHELKLLADTIDKTELMRTIYGLRELNYVPGAVVLLTSVVERSMWRYREPRTYSVILNDIGHLIETLRLMANAHGIRYSIGHGFDDIEVAELLDVDPLEQPCFQFATLG